MAITLNIYYTGENVSARKFVEEMISSRTVEKIRNESGNLKYEYFIPLDDDNTILLIDTWQTFIYKNSRKDEPKPIKKMNCLGSFFCNFTMV